MGDDPVSVYRLRVQFRWKNSFRTLEKTVLRKTDAYPFFLGAPLGEGEGGCGAFPEEAFLQGPSPWRGFFHGNKRSLRAKGS